MIDLYALFELILLIRYFQKNLKNMHLDKASLRQEHIERYILMFLVLMCVMRIAVSDIYLAVITCRYWFDNERSYYNQELDYEWINFASDLLESFTAFATLYMFHFYLKRHLKD